MNTICRLYCSLLARPEAWAEITCGLFKSQTKTFNRAIYTRENNMRLNYVASYPRREHTRINGHFL